MAVHTYRTTATRCPPAWAGLSQVTSLSGTLPLWDQPYLKREAAHWLRSGVISTAGRSQVAVDHGGRGAAQPRGLLWALPVQRPRVHSQAL